MIAKIYGKSNKSVHGTSYNDNFKKPKVHHMKEILKSKQSQSKKREETASTVTNNIRKVKIQNSKLKSIQVNKDRDADQITTRATKKNLTYTIVNPKSPISLNAQAASGTASSTRPKKFVKVAASLEPGSGSPSKKPHLKTATKITMVKTNQNQNKIDNSVM